MARGYNALGDLIQLSADGQDLNDIWAEFQATLELRNQNRSALAALFTYPTTLASDTVLQTATGGDFEEASEYGVPQGMHTVPDAVQVGFPIKDYDTATRYTWKFLRDASASQIQAVHRLALEADNRLVFKKVMTALFAPTSTGFNESGIPVQPLWNGDGIVPPEFANSTFSGTHSHYLTTGSVNVDPQDLEDLTGTITHHGYGLPENGDRVIVLLNPLQGKTVAGFRAGQNGASFDFIPASDAPAFITSETITGNRPPGSFNGLKVIGSYGDAWIVQNAWMPAGYLVAVATSGPNSPSNPLAFREHANTKFRGLLQLPGSPNADYPLTDSYYYRGFGVGVRHRGAAAVMQVTTNASYTAPVIK